MAGARSYSAARLALEFGSFRIGPRTLLARAYRGEVQISTLPSLFGLDGPQIREVDLPRLNTNIDVPSLDTGLNLPSLDVPLDIPSRYTNIEAPSIDTSIYLPRLTHNVDVPALYSDPNLPAIIARIDAWPFWD